MVFKTRMASRIRALNAWGVSSSPWEIAKGSWSALKRFAKPEAAKRVFRASNMTLGSPESPVIDRSSGETYCLISPTPSSRDILAFH